MKQFKCSMSKKIESLGKKSEANLDDLKGMVVSEGTMRSEDLIPKFLNVLKTYGKDKYDAYVKENPEVLDLEGMDDETMGYVFDELFDKLDEIAPEGFYFAAHPDDGACYGFWEVDPNESKKSEATTEDISVKLTELKDVTDADKVLDDLKKLGFYTIEYGDYASKDKSYAVLKHPNGMYAELDYTWVQDSSGRDSYSPGEVLEYDYYKDKDEYEEIHGYSPNESKKPEACKGGKDDDKKVGKDGKAAESKKSEGVSGTIKMNIDYNTFMRLLDAATYLEADDDYKDALWDYYSEFGEIDGNAFEFFDNLFQYTDWKTAEEIWDDYSNILGEKPEGQDAEEALDAYLEENGLGGESAYKHGDHYLIVR